ncbi:DgyrCDS278 [Dimorphilus gyrociliatus]|uniref:RNA-binding protein 48 n=1 Tax=Dimorphilus gyrociliatus TaxID=2664684 RepID=A0A7I8V5U7_9ANNE|nr:DgyrCDS278 [Dimorphilus gyrociliatus]
MIAADEVDKSKLRDHHIKQEYCLNRPKYRRGRKLRAVKTYTISQESHYLLIQNVPSIKVNKELESNLVKFGKLEKLENLSDYPREEFSEVYFTKFTDIQSARNAKKKLDDTPFFGSTLHVCYAPEFETVDETKHKLEVRRLEVEKRLNELKAPRIRKRKKIEKELTNEELREKAIKLKDVQGPSLIPKIIQQ